MRARSWSNSTAAMPIAVAGAGPSSAAASTSARNEPEMRCPPWLTANQVRGQGEAEQQRDEGGRLPVVGRGRQCGDHDRDDEHDRLGDDQRCCSCRTRCAKFGGAGARAPTTAPRRRAGPQVRARSPPRSAAAGGAACSGGRAGRARCRRSASRGRDHVRRVVLELGAERPSDRAARGGARRKRRRAPRRRGSPAGSRGRRARTRPPGRTRARLERAAGVGEAGREARRAVRGAAEPDRHARRRLGLARRCPATSSSSAITSPSLPASAAPTRCVVPRARNGT